MTEIGDLIKRARLRNGLTQEELAAKVGHKASYISRIEIGALRGSEEILFKLSKALDLVPQRVFNAAGISNVVFVPTRKDAMNAQVYEFSKLDPKIRRLLLEMAPIIEKYLEDDNPS